MSETSKPQADAGDEPPVVRLRMYAHWTCPECGHENHFLMGQGIPFKLKCAQCGLVVKTLQF